MNATGRSEHRARILLIDDLPANLLALHAILDDLGHELVDARTADEALRLAGEHEFALVLLDLQMPGRNGLEIARLIRNQARSPSVPIIFLTAFESEEFSVARAYELGAVDYLVKPLVPAILRSKVAVFVDLFVKVEQIKRQAQQIQESERLSFERRLDEERVRQVEARLALAAIVESSNDAIISESLDGVIETWNRGAERLFGYTAAEAVGRSVSLIVPPDRMFEMRQYLAAVATGQRLEHFETVRQRKDGSLIDVSLSVSPVRNERDEVIGASKTARDITEKKQAEESVRRSRQQISDILESINDALTVLDHEWRIVYVNEATLQRTGRRREEVLGGNVWEVFPQFFGTPIEMNLRSVMERRVPVRFEGIGPHSKRWFDMTIYPTAEGVSIFSRDIHERRLAEQSLQESQQRFARFMQHLPGLAWIKDAQGRYVYVNEAAERAFGKSRTELYGKTDGETFPPDVAARFSENDRQARQTPAGIQIVESLQHPDGTTHHSIVSKFPIPNVAGIGDMIGGIAIDVTERMAAEKALQDADRLKDEFLAMLGHELRNPLSGIVGAAQVLSVVGMSRPEAAEMVRVIERQSAHMSHMMNDLLEVSRISRGKIQLAPAPLDLVELTGRACRDALDAAARAGLELQVSLPDRPLIIHADDTRLTQVVTNLLQNAIKFTNTGGRISVSVNCRDDGLAEFRIRDTGIGLSAEDLSRVFQPFAQSGDARQRSSGGLGLGLAIVKGLIELHGGHVTATSSGLGHGAEFIFQLPRTELEEVRGRESHSAQLPLSPRRVLVIDDEADARIPLCKLLELDRHIVEAASDGPSGIEAAIRFRPDVVLCDIKLTGQINGYDIARTLRRDERTSSALLVAVTGFGQEKDRRQAVEAGFDHHLTKPVSQHQIRELIAEKGYADFRRPLMS